MRLAADTNLLLRVVLDDDAEQSRAARRVLSQADPLFIPILVLCELVWVLRRLYRFPESDVRTALIALTTPLNVDVDRPVLAAGLGLMAQGGGFADGCILEMARMRRCRLATFDRKLARLGGPDAYVAVLAE